jgi:hypothetical protein
MIYCVCVGRARWGREELDLPTAFNAVQLAYQLCEPDENLKRMVMERDGNGIKAVTKRGWYGLRAFQHIKGCAHISDITPAEYELRSPHHNANLCMLPLVWSKTGSKALPVAYQASNALHNGRRSHSKTSKTHGLPQPSSKEYMNSSARMTTFVLSWT